MNNLNKRREKKVLLLRNSVKIIFSFESDNLCAIKKPKNNEPIIDTIKLLFIDILRNVAAYETKRIMTKFFIFIL